MRREQAGRLRIRDLVGVEAEHHVGLGRGALQLEAGEQRAGILALDPFERAAADRLEALLDRARPDRIRSGKPL